MALSSERSMKMNHALRERNRTAKTYASTPMRGWTNFRHLTPLSRVRFLTPHIARPENARTPHRPVQAHAKRFDPLIPAAAPNCARRQVQDRCTGGQPGPRPAQGPAESNRRRCASSRGQHRTQRSRSPP
jgi:hypothetical protein